MDLLLLSLFWGREKRQSVAVPRNGMAACSIQAACYAAGGSPLKVAREGGPFRGDTFIK